jgi:hypothetical protein
MADRRLPIVRRIQAAESLITFETSEDIAERTKAFLVAVAESKHVAFNLRLDAGRLVRKVESRRVVTPGTRAIEPREWHETFRRIAIARRRMRLIKQDLWPCPKDWCADLYRRGGLKCPDNQNCS